MIEIAEVEEDCSTRPATAAQGGAAARPLRLETTPCGRLAVRRGDELIAVQLRRCFPWSGDDSFLSLRDEGGEEIALLDNAARLDAPSRAALGQALRIAGFALEIERVERVEEELEIRCWTVRTCAGWRRFQTRLDEWPARLPDGRYLLRCVSGDSYLIPDPATLDPFTREHLVPYIG